MMLRGSLLLSSVLALAACGSSGSSDAPTPPTPGEAFDAAVRQAADMADPASLGMPTFASNRPDTGAAVFEGPALITMNDGAREPAFAGSAEIRADFATSTVSGVMTDFLFAADTDDTGAAGPVIPAAGNLTVGPGAIVSVPRGPGMARGLGSDNLVTGVLVAGGDSYRFNQTVEGVFFGNPDPRSVVMSGDGVVGVGTDSLDSSILVVAD
ncbi:hypothetical protein [Wenxinia marina]|uniref:Uncharacterized protein n=1 Tax=Wenxinia marina DSM 24838 TaxID=1123501 RepID=A0A0D0PB44_9RHOB|nr:hypothetical protein [Wenxinia marina]KIQ68646.1 hypothetical protein Wenmar_02917 [Wenxinia marina DSM 24838]